MLAHDLSTGLVCKILEMDSYTVLNEPKSAGKLTLSTMAHQQIASLRYRAGLPISAHTEPILPTRALMMQFMTLDDEHPQTCDWLHTIHAWLPPRRRLE